MAVRQDQVQLRIDFITDESRALARTLETTRAYNRELEQSQAKIKNYQKELAQTNITEARRAELLAKVATEEKKVADNLAKVAAEGKKVEKLDLSKVTPAQLVERAKQLNLAMRQIPQSAPQFRQLQTELSAVNTRLREISQTAKGVQGGSGTGGGVFGSLTGLATRGLGIFGGIAAGFQALRSAIGGASALEQLNISFEVFLGNAEKAKQVVLDLREFADVTPFETEQVNRAGRSLLAFGISAEELIPTLQQIGDVAAGTGKDFNELAIIYGKARTEGLIQNDTLNQLAEAGIPIYTELAKVLKVNESQIRKLAEQGKIQFKDLQTAFENLTNEGSKFGGLMEKQSQSIGGLWSTLLSGLQNLATSLGTALTPLIKSLLQGLIPAIEQLGRIAVPVFEGISKALTFIFDEIVRGVTVTVPNLIRSFREMVSEIPVLGKGFENLFLPVRAVIDSFESLPAAAAGAMAALKTIFKDGGYSAAEAYTQARNEVLERARAEERRAAAEAARDDRQLNEEEQKAQTEAQKKADAERTAARQKEFEERQRRLDAALAAQLKSVEVATQRELLLAENARIKDEIDEEAYLERISAINEAGLRQRLEVYQNFKREQVNEALELQNRLAEIEAGRGLRNAAPLATLPTRQPGAVTSETGNEIDLGPTVPTPDALRARFGQLIDAELQYQILRGELQSAYYSEQLAQLEASGKAETDEYNRIAEEKKAADQSVADNKAQLADFERQLEEANVTFFQESLNLGIELLSRDAAARKQYASTIKAFQTGQVIVSGIAEIQKIWEKSAAFGPLQAIIAAIQTAAAVARTTTAITRISNTKFARGGYTGIGYGAPDSSGYRPAGVVHEGEYVVPKRMVDSPHFRPQIEYLEQVRLRGFATGGFVDTTPAPLPSSPALQSGMFGQIAMLDDAVRRFEKVVDEFPTEVKSRVVYVELEETGAELNRVRADAAS